MEQLTITQPDDWHLHLRDGDFLATTVQHTAQQFARAIIMPNLVPPVTTVGAALAYRQRIISHIPAGHAFTPLMTLYLTDSLSVDEIQKAAAHPHIYAIKYYPQGATTNSSAGVQSVDSISTQLAAMEAENLPLLVHGETTDPRSDIFDREKLFLDTTLSTICLKFPKLKIVVEHITTQEAVQFVLDHPQCGATITPQHLYYNRNDLLVGGIKPHLYCLPVLKRNVHQQALIDIATQAHTRFFLGTDSAPHVQTRKESACGCAGVYSSFAAIELYAELFEHYNALDKLEAFASLNGANFYGLPVNATKITLEKTEWEVPATYPFGHEQVIPMRAGEKLAWRLR